MKEFQMSKTLKNLVEMKMEQENLSLRKAGDQAGVAHTTIDRVTKEKSISDIGIKLTQ
jgi:hypothetical protein